MDLMQKSQLIKDSLWKGFQESSSKLAQRKCNGYDIRSYNKLVINSDEATVVHWNFDQYLSGHSLRNIASALELKSILFPTGKSKWNREAFNKLLFNEKHKGRVPLQKTVSTGTAQI